MMLKLYFLFLLKCIYWIDFRRQHVEFSFYYPGPKMTFELFGSHSSTGTDLYVEKKNCFVCGWVHYMSVYLCEWVRFLHVHVGNCASIDVMSQDYKIFCCEVSEHLITCLGLAQNLLLLKVGDVSIFHRYVVISSKLMSLPAGPSPAILSTIQLIIY